MRRILLPHEVPVPLAGRIQIITVFLFGRNSIFFGTGAKSRISLSCAATPLDERFQLLVMQEANPFSRNLHLEAVYESWFNFADGDGDGKISGSEAVAFFSRSKLTRQELRQIWKVCDGGNTGSLSKEDFQIALKLIALCQQGQELLGNDVWTGNVEDDVTLSKLALAERQGLHGQGRHLRPPTLEGLDHTTSTGQQKLIL